MTTTVVATNPMGSGAHHHDHTDAADLRVALRNELLRLAHREDSLALEEASRVAYWEACPSSVTGHREAARALRDGAARLLSLVTDGPRG